MTNQENPNTFTPVKNATLSLWRMKMKKGKSRNRAKPKDKNFYIGKSEDKIPKQSWYIKKENDNIA